MLSLTEARPYLQSSESQTFLRCEPDSPRELIKCADSHRSSFGRSGLGGSRVGVLGDGV